MGSLMAQNGANSDGFHTAAVGMLRCVFLWGNSLIPANGLSTNFWAFLAHFGPDGPEDGYVFWVDPHQDPKTGRNRSVFTFNCDFRLCKNDGFTNMI